MRTEFRPTDAHECALDGTATDYVKIAHRLTQRIIGPELREGMNCTPPPRVPRCKAAAGVPGAVSFCGIALVTLMRRPSTSVLSMAAIASRSPFSSANMTNPKPRDRPVARSNCTRAPIAPNSRNSANKFKDRLASFHHTAMRVRSKGHRQPHQTPWCSAAANTSLPWCICVVWSHGRQRRPVRAKNAAET